MNKILIFLIFFGLFTGCTKSNSFLPKDGYVPNKQTAISIAIAVLGPIYGVENIKNQAPYSAELHGDIWEITGSMPKDTIVTDKDGFDMVTIYMGGVATIHISKNTGSVLFVSHGE